MTWRISFYVFIYLFSWGNNILCMILFCCFQMSCHTSNESSHLLFQPRWLWLTDPHLIPQKKRERKKRENRKIQSKKYQQWNCDCFLILMSVVGPWLWGWVITLSLPFASNTGRCSVSLGCQLLPKALLTQRYSFRLFISCLYLYFPSTDVWEYLWLKHNILFHFGKEIKLFFFQSTGKRHNPLR